MGIAGVIAVGVMLGRSAVGLRIGVRVAEEVVRRMGRRRLIMCLAGIIVFSLAVCEDV